MAIKNADHEKVRRFLLPEKDPAKGLQGYGQWRLQTSAGQTSDKLRTR